MDDPVDTGRDRTWLCRQVQLLFEEARGQKEKDHKTLLEYAKLLRDLLPDHGDLPAPTVADNNPDKKLSASDEPEPPSRLTEIRAAVQGEIQGRRNGAKPAE